MLLAPSLAGTLGTSLAQLHFTTSRLEPEVRKKVEVDSNPESSTWNFFPHIRRPWTPLPWASNRGFGGAGNRLLLDIHIPETTLAQLVPTRKTSVAQFLQQLQHQIATSMLSPPSKVIITGIHESYRADGLGKSANDSQIVDGSRTSSTGREVLVSLMVELADTDRSMGVEQVVQDLHEALTSRKSTLMQGDLKHALEQASVTLGTTPLFSQYSTVQREKRHWTVVLIVLGISGGFILLLLCAAATMVRHGD